MQCDECDKGYNKNSTGQCQKCYCNDVCSKNSIEYENCFCKDGYTKVDKSCIPCEAGCSDCYSNIKNTPVCKNCNSGTFLKENKCLNCPDGCNKCKNESICIECNYNYILNSTYNNCTLCSNVAGEGCERCIYNKNNNQYECLECSKSNDPYYVYINNTQKCLKITDSNNKELFGCLKANNETNKFNCFQCKDGFIKAKNENSCINLTKQNLSQSCLEVEKLGEVKTPLYSCSKCPNNYYLILNDSDKIKNCVEINQDSPQLPYCLEGKGLNINNINCTKCVEHATLKDNICICNSDSFGYKNLSCYKCDDEKRGNSGCNATLGCKYFPFIDELDCNECKEGYFKYSKGQCFSCSDVIRNCEKCSLNDKEEIKCEKCMDLYTLNDNKDTFELNECKEYPEISPGCIICEDKLKEYKSNNKCQTCKYGYFLTKEEKCVYCRSEEYGGPACYECGYEKEGSDKIICKDCYSHYDYNNLYNYNSSYQYYTSTISSDGKCYNNKINLIPHCKDNVFFIGDYKFYYYLKDISDKVKLDNNSEYDLSHYNEIMKNKESTINATCEYCEDGYILNDKGECEIFNLNNCTGRSLSNKITLDDCINLCGINHFPFIYLLLENNSMDNNIDNYYNISYINNNMKILYLFLYADNIEETIKNFTLDNQICLNISKNNLREKYSHCERVIYNPINDSFDCFKCEYNYNFSSENKTCFPKEEEVDYDIYCSDETNGISSNLERACNKCHNYDETLVTYESGNKTCISNEKALENCITANATSNYIKNLYNCTSCRDDHILYYSKYYGRYMCHNVFEKIIKSKNISLDKFKGEESITTGENGYFTPDGKKYYKCDNEIVGMPGCKGNCSFSDSRENTILCLDGCKEGYIESSPNICEACDSINAGCYQCHYENSYPENYSGIKRERRFICDYCKDGYIRSEDEKCISYREEGCKEIELNKTTINCTSCQEHYILEKNNDLNKCKLCIVSSAIINNKCIACDDEKKKKKNCKYCQENEKGDGVICKQCQDNYILISDNNTCFERNDNKELEKHNTCLELRTENKKLICSRCIKDFSLIKISDGDKTEFKCIYTPTLYDPNLKFYYFDKIIEPHLHLSGGNKLDFLKTDYLYRQTQFLPCKEAINLSTGDNYLYSCNKCYNIFDNETYDFYYYLKYYENESYFYSNSINNYFIGNNEGYIWNSYPVKIDDKTAKSSYCIKAKKEIENCVEATYNISHGKEIYNCTKCMNGYYLSYNRKLNINYCSIIKEGKCLVDYCEACVNNNSNICSTCINSSYVVNNYTGSCVLKTKKEPDIKWKDLYSFNRKGQKEINGQLYRGPSFKLRGITMNQISKRHAFLVYLIFKLKHLLRNLQETKNISAICQIENNVEETIDDVNIVDYDCIGKETVDDIYQFSDIQGINFTNVINNIRNTISNYNEENKPLLFDLENYEDFKNKTFNKTTIDFSLIGKFKNLKSKEIKNQTIIEMELNEVEDSVKCGFTRYKEKEANFTCNLEITSNISSTNLTFKNNEIDFDDNLNIYMNQLDKIKLRLELENDNNDIPPESSVIKEEKKSYKTLITIAIIVGVVFIIGIVIVIIFSCKAGNKGKIQDFVNEISKDDSNNFASQNNINEV